MSTRHQSCIYMFTSLSMIRSFGQNYFKLGVLHNCTCTELNRDWQLATMAPPDPDSRKHSSRASRRKANAFVFKLQRSTLVMRGELCTISINVLH